MLSQPNYIPITTYSICIKSVKTHRYSYMIICVCVSGMRLYISKSSCIGCEQARQNGIKCAQTITRSRAVSTLSAGLKSSARSVLWWLAHVLCVCLPCISKLKWTRWCSKLLDFSLLLILVLTSSCLISVSLVIFRFFCWIFFWPRVTYS